MNVQPRTRLAAIMLEQEILDVLQRHFRETMGQRVHRIELAVEEAPDGSQHFTALAEFD